MTEDERRELIEEGQRKREEFLAQHPERRTVREQQEENMRELAEADAYDVVMPRGIPTRVPRGVCRCPILDVGDFCPVHGG